MGRLISNDSDCKDLEPSEGGSITKTSYVITLADFGWFAFSCIAAPAAIAGRAAQATCEGRDLYKVICNAREIKELMPLFAEMGVVGATVGGAVGGVIALGGGSIGLLPLCLVGGAVGVPYVVLNGVIAVLAVRDIGPLAFRRAAWKTLNSRAYKALTTGAPRVREKLKNLANTPVYTRLESGPK